MKKRVVIAGFGDTGLCAATCLSAAGGYDIVGITPKPCHHSMQELGGRLAQPSLWQQLYLLPFSVYRQLDGVRIVQACVTRIDLKAQLVFTQLPDGRTSSEPYDALLISSGVSSGFWRTAKMESRQEITRAIQAEHEQIAAANTVAVVGGGPSGVSAAYCIQRRFPKASVHLFLSRDKVLPGKTAPALATIAWANFT
jgi:NADH dehydrogenase FAD-containing subunit